VEHAQLQDAALGFVLLQLYKVFQPFSILFFPFLFFLFGSWTLLSFYQWQQHLEQLIPENTPNLAHIPQSPSGTLARHFHTNISMKSINEIAFGIASYAINRMRARFP